MYNRGTLRRTISALLLSLAMLIVSVAMIVPTSADYTGGTPDIRDFGFQTLSDASQTSSSTDLRFVFTIGSLAYDEVGFVFSSTNPAPTVNDSDRWRATTVYSSISAGSGTVSAPAGRYWVAVKLSNVPNAHFEDAIYVRPYVKNNGVYSYADAKSITVCEALTFDKTVAGEENVYDSTNPSGPYDVLEGFEIAKRYADIRGSEHFYPHSSNNYEGNDLWFEYSFLWNRTLENWDTGGSRMEVMRLLRSNTGHRALYLLFARDGVSQYVPFKGHFDMANNYPDAIESIIEGTQYPVGYVPVPERTEDKSPAIGAEGWHRIGVRFHQEVASVSGSTVTYAGFTELYLDGVKLWKVAADVNGTLKNDGLLLFNAWASNGNVTSYSDGNNWTYVQMRMSAIANSTNPVYVAVSDVHWTCGDGFVRQVSPVSDPAERTINLGGTVCSAKIWYVFDN